MTGREDVRLVKLEAVHEGWSRISIATLVVDGQTITREVEDHGSAVGLLPYDPERRVAMLARQLRAPVLVTTGETSLLEAPAGLREGDDAGAEARREAMEETGLRLGPLDGVGTVWSMPGVSTERISLFLAPYAAADRVGAGGGVAGEHENITVVELSLAELASLADAGRLDDMKTLLLVQTLRLRRPDLFAAAPAPS